LHVCPATVNQNNWLGGGTTGETFAVAQNGTEVTVSRSDTGNSQDGWDIDLRFDCCQQTAVPTAAPTYNSVFVETIGLSYIYDSMSVADAACKSAGYASLCTQQEVTDASREMCSAGWTLENSRGYWTTVTKTGCGSANAWTTFSDGNMGAAHCCDSPGFVTSNPGSTSCSVGGVKATAAYCQVAASSLGGIWNGIGSWCHIQSGCVEYLSNGNLISYNECQDNNGNNNYILICRQVAPTPAPTPEPTAPTLLAAAGLSNPVQTSSASVSVGGLLDRTVHDFGTPTRWYSRLDE
jgi:hypothetical protein